MRFMHKSPTIFKNKIRKQMYFILIPLIVIPVLFIGTSLTTYFVKALYKQSSQQLTSDNIRVKSILLDCLINIYNISTDIVSDKNLQKILTTDYVDFSTEAGSDDYYERIQDYMDTTTSLTGITIYTENPTIQESKYVKYLTTELKEELYSKVTAPSSCSWIYYYSNKLEDTSSELMLIRSFPLVQSEYPAIITITVSNNYLKNRIQNNSLYTAVSLNRNTIFFCTTRSMQGKNQSVPIDYSWKYYKYSGIIDFNKERVLGHISVLPIYQSDDVLYITTMDSSGFHNIINIMLMCIAITLLSILIPLMGILFYTKIFSSRVVSLRTAMKSASLGNFDIIDTLKGDDELSETFMDLLNMIQILKKKEAKMYESQLIEKELKNQQQKMEFKILTSQINPHFIYNTLETIRMLSLEEGNKNVASAIKLLGKSMHYVLENTETFSTTLDKELDYIKVYLQIQKLRFEDRINYSIEMPENFSPKEYQILPLLLQPIVENAVLHGLEDISKNGFVNVRLAPKNNSVLYIDIQDNGKGMTEEELKTLSSGKTDKLESDRTSIGLSNIKRRIHLFYGKEYGIQIESSTEIGTKVHFILPLIPT